MEITLILRISSSQFMTILSNITAIKIRGSYFIPGDGYIDSVELETALVKKVGNSKNADRRKEPITSFCIFAVPYFIQNLI